MKCTLVNSGELYMNQNQIKFPIFFYNNIIKMKTKKRKIEKNRYYISPVRRSFHSNFLHCLQFPLRTIQSLVFFSISFYYICVIFMTCHFIPCALSQFQLFLFEQCDDQHSETDSEALQTNLNVKQFFDQMHTHLTVYQSSQRKTNGERRNSQTVTAL